ncbi:CIR protein PIR protein [Plasmodium vinckei vinckei]|uniref:CIR protein PIR protein n=1 Tax=Plasmodium vinckei vinckei TaxID=54757 RepID=A0A449BMT1_PLAVN|nr:CIR protein PIR protein [Plasmodium vinckei vinckei]VEV54734.1 CIR protein PIR protein [Plasmodium vinckei vinckei]
MGVKSCDTFREIDELFIDYEKNEDKFNNAYGPYNNYCPVNNGGRKCETNYEKLNAISRYAYMELIQNKKVDLESENDLRADFLVMRLCDILYKLSNNPNLSLKDAFEKYLDKHMGAFNHWSILSNKKYFNGSNIGIMNGFYFLFQQICETINRYNNPNAKTYEHTHDIQQFYIIYHTLYNFVNRCDPYLQLFYHLKTIYDDIISGVIKFDANDQELSNQIIMLSSIDTTKLLSEFNTKGCKQVHKKLEQNISRNKEKSEEEEEEQGGFDTLIDLFGLDDDDDDNDGGNDDLDLDEEEDGDDLQNTTQGTPPVSVPGPQQPGQSTSVPVKQVPTPSGASPSIPDNGSDTIGSKDKVVDSTQSQENTKGGEQTDTGGDTGNKANLQSDSSIHTPTSGNNQGGESRDGLDGGSNGNQVNQGGSGGINDGKGDKDISKGGTCTGSCDGADSGTGSGKGGTNNTLPSQGNSSNQGGSDDGSKGSGDQDATKSSETFYGYSSSNWGSRLNPLNYLPSASSIYQSSKNILTSATNQVNNAYNSAVTAVKDNYDSVVAAVKDTYDSAVTAVKNTYDTTMTTVKGAYSATTNYIDGTVSSIINQLNSFDTFSQLDDHQSRSGGSGNSLPTNNSPLKTPVPQSHSPSVTLPPSQTSPPSPSQPHSSQTQDSPQITDQNDRSDPIQIHDTNPGTGMPRTLTNFSKNHSSTGNGTTNGTVVKMNEKTSIWCIGSNKKFDLMGIGIIFISASIILAIMYKYISFGSGTHSKKKKTMKRVIKYGDGTRKTRIIIKSHDRNKHLKPVINSVGRKKYPLLNIYKLMQADPMPFINLFFLLIFFVYKRKLNYLEL